MSRSLPLAEVDWSLCNSSTSVAWLIGVYDNGRVEWLLGCRMSMVGHILVVSSFDPGSIVTEHDNHNDGQGSGDSEKGGADNQHSSALARKNGFFNAIRNVTAWGIQRAAVCLQVNAFLRELGVELETGSLVIRVIAAGKWKDRTKDRPYAHADD
jgi:hypothetical protein